MQKKPIPDQPSASDKLFSSPVVQALRDREILTTAYANANWLRYSDFQELAHFAESQKILSDTLSSSEWLRFKTAIDTLQSVKPINEEIIQIASIHAEIAKTVIDIRTPVIPILDQFDEMIRAIIKPFEKIQADMEKTHKDIREQAERLVNPWALSGMEALSVSGFTKLSCLSNFAHSNSPFEGKPASYYRDQLYVSEKGLEGRPEEKDELAVQFGLNPELIAFYPLEYSQVLIEAGFSISFDHVTVPKSEGAENGGKAYSPVHDAVLKQVEIMLRQLIEKKLYAISGTNWIEEHVPQHIVKKWNKIRQNAQKSSGKCFSLILYADFMDLTLIICDERNWDNVFGTVFSSKDDFYVSMTRLHPIRNDIAHSRPLARSEVLVLVAESSRILTVLRRELG